ncbi:MAG: DUF3048 domain-containing protein [Trueperaceae bacterium]|nr:DUF3048 domain-containing protein [Trueperaceae bacterium]
MSENSENTRYETIRKKDKRRALLLSLMVHATLLLVLLLIPNERPPEEQFVVIDIGTPSLADVVTEAPTVDAPAPQAPDAQTADVQAGTPQSSATDATSTPNPAPSEPPVAAAPSEPTPAEPTPAPPPPPPAEAATPSEPATSAPSSVASEPDIDQVEIDTTEQPLPRPDIRPEVQAEVTPEQPVEVTPQVEVAPEQTIPQPEVQAEVTPEQPVEITPQVEVTPEQAIPQPEVQAEVAPEQPVEVTPQVEVAPEQTIPQPDVQAEVTPEQPVEVTPQVEVAPEQTIPQPDVQAEIAPEEVLPQPQVRAEIAPEQPVEIAPQVSVVPAEPLPIPDVRAEVTRLEPEPEVQELRPSPQDAEADLLPTPEGVDSADSAVPSSRDSNRPAGADAAQSGQDRDQADASTDNLGAAASPDGSLAPTGAPITRRERFSASLDRPLAVMIDNVRGYPQMGLREASIVVEMPVEGGLTRLMSVYDRSYPANVGPIRSARDYFHTLAQNMEGILVHDGGSPAALDAIARSSLPTFNSYSSGDLFARQDGRSAPYNLYSNGNALRDAINRLRLQRPRLVSGTEYRADPSAPPATTVTVRYSGGYSSGFGYRPETDQYRWLRNAQPASDATGEAVLVDAVVVADIVAQPIPGDEAGRLYIPLSGGTATLYVNGRAVPGRWNPSGGFQFIAEGGEMVDLAAFKYWVLFAPQNAAVSAE